MNRLLPLIGLLGVFALASAGFSPRPALHSVPVPTPLSDTDRDSPELPAVRKYSIRISASTEVRQAFPFVPLPAHVVAPEGRLTIFADYDLAADNRVPIYIVNRTAKDISLADQDGDLYLKLECESAPGVWTRAETHRYSFCGNSYGSTWLPAGQFLTTTGYRPPTGKVSKVRYRFYSGMKPGEFSNAGDGLARLSDIHAAESDDMATRQRSFLTPSRIRRPR